MTAKNEKHERQPNHENLRTIDGLSPRQPDVSKGSEQQDQNGRKKHETSTENISGSTDTTHSKWQRVESALRMVSILAVTGSAVLAVWKYVDSQVAERKERSIGYMTAWQGSEARDAYARLQEALVPVVADAGELPSALGPRAVELAQKGIGMGVVKSWVEDDTAGYSGWRNDIDVLVNFYSELDFCLEATLCYEELLVDYFQASLTSFWLYFSSYAEFQRSQYYPDYGVRVDALMQKMKE